MTSEIRLFFVVLATATIKLIWSWIVTRVCASVWSMLRQDAGASPISGASCVVLCVVPIHLLKGSVPLVQLNVTTYKRIYSGEDYSLCWSKTWFMRGISLLGGEARQQVLYFSLGDLIVLVSLTTCGRP